MKTKNPRQYAMDFDVAQDAIVSTVSHAINYTEMPLGTGAGYRKVVEACPECGHPGVTKHNDQNLTWIHSEEIVLNAKSDPKRNILSKCQVKR